jgi:hypothetical protein
VIYRLYRQNKQPFRPFEHRHAPPKHRGRHARPLHRHNRTQPLQSVRYSCKQLWTSRRASRLSTRTSRQPEPIRQRQRPGTRRHAAASSVAASDTLSRHARKRTSMSLLESARATHLEESFFPAEQRYPRRPMARPSKSAATSTTDRNPASKRQRPVHLETIQRTRRVQYRK